MEESHVDEIEDHLLLTNQTTRWRFLLITAQEKESLHGLMRCSLPTPLYYTPQIIIKAFLSYFGNLLFWLGAWGIFSQEQKGDTDELSDSLFPKTAGVQSLYIVVGMLATMAMDAFYGGVGLDTPLNPRESLVPNGLRWWSVSDVRLMQILFSCRLLIAFVGTVVLWVGLYNVLDNFLFPWSLLCQVLYLIIGIVLLMVTNTLSCMACIFPIESLNRRYVRSFDDVSSFVVSWEATLDYVRREGLPFIRGLVSLVAQNMIWVGGFNILAYFSPLGPSLGREMLYALLGIFLFFATNSFLSNTWIDYRGGLTLAAQNARPVIEDRVVSLAFVLRCLIVIAAQVLGNTGFWVMLDEYTVSSSYGRDLVYGAIGFVMVVLSGTTCTNCGVLPPKYVSLASIMTHDEASSHFLEYVNRPSPLMPHRSTSARHSGNTPVVHHPPGNVLPLLPLGPHAPPHQESDPKKVVPLSSSPSRQSSPPRHRQLNTSDNADDHDQHAPTHLSNEQRGPASHDTSVDDDDIDFQPFVSNTTLESSL